MLRLYLYARVRVLKRKWHTGPRVQRAPGLPCALSILRRDTRRCKTRAQRAARSRSYIRVSSSAKAGDLVAQRRPRLNREAAAYWIPQMRGDDGFAVRHTLLPRRQPVPSLARGADCMLTTTICCNASAHPAKKRRARARTIRCRNESIQNANERATLRLFFCLRVMIEMAMTYFRRMESQEKSKEKHQHRGVANEIKTWRGKGKRG